MELDEQPAVILFEGGSYLSIKYKGGYDMANIELYANYGCLGAEKRNLWTYGNPAGNGVSYDKLTFEIPDGWRLYETVTGGMAITSPWGDNYDVNDILEGNDDPYFAAYNNEGKLKRFKLKGMPGA